MARVPTPAGTEARRDRLLIVDDEPNARSALVTLLSEEGFDTSEASDGQEALERMERLAPDAVLTDLRMPRLDGLSLMREARARKLDAVFVVMTAFGSVESAVEAMRDGAESYLVKPVNIQAAIVVVRKALERRRLRRDAEGLRERIRERYRFANIIGQSAALQNIFAVVKQAAPTKATVLILGESGTGKELIAQALHEESPRRDGPFVKVNCAALTESLLESELFGHEKGAFTGALARKEGRFERADGGSLFLDEIGEISPAVQVKLLRVLQQREFERVGGSETIKVDVRVIAATNKDLAAEVKAGRFREDLFYRLNVVSVTLPPLRARKEDLPELVSHFVERFAKAYDKPVHGLAPGVLATLSAHDWPGNVRELEHALERAVVMCAGSELTAEDLPQALQGPRSAPVSPGAAFAADATLADIEREAILRTLERCNGSTVRAAEILGISQRKVQYKLKEYGQAARGSPGADAGAADDGE